MRWVKALIGVVIILLIVVQVIKPARTNPSIDPRREIFSNLSVDAQVGATLARSCNDCHSNRTVWPWYSHIAPVSWLIVSDVNRGRKALNFSEWGNYGTKEQREHLADICNEVTEGEMPSFSYTLMHRGASLSKAEVATVCGWTRTLSQGSMAEGQ